MPETNDFFEYGKKLEKLGQMFQDPTTNLSDILRISLELGLIMTFRVEPDPRKSIDMTVDMAG